MATFSNLQSIFSFQMLCLSNAMATAKEYHYTTAVLFAYVELSSSSPLSLCIVLFIFPQKADPTITFSFSCRIYEVLPLRLLYVFWVTQYIFPLAYFLSTA